MRVLVVGASGAIGARLVPKLRERGHEVIGSSRSPAKAGRLRELGAEPIVLDLLDAPAVRRAVLDTRPAAIAFPLATIAAARAMSAVNKVGTAAEAMLWMSKVANAAVETPPTGAAPAALAAPPTPLHGPGFPAAIA